VAHPDEVENRIHGGGNAPVVAQAELDVLARGEMREQRVVLENGVDAALIRRQVRDRRNSAALRRIGVQPAIMRSVVVCHIRKGLTTQTTGLVRRRTRLHPGAMAGTRSSHRGMGASIVD
jgi:hypothetical protein